MHIHSFQLPKSTLKLWGIWFEKSKIVQFQCKKEVAILDATILGVDPALAVVSGCSKDEDEAQPTPNEAEEKALSVQLLCEELQRGGEVGTTHRQHFRESSFVCLS